MVFCSMGLAQAWLQAVQRHKLVGHGLWKGIDLQGLETSDGW